VSLVADVLAILPVLRAQAESMMLDTCTIQRPGAPVTDPNTGVVTPGMTTIYTGKCKVQSKDSATSTPEAGGAVFVVVSRQIHIPAGAADVRNDDVVTVTASVLNPFGVGRKYRVEGFTPDSFDTAARIPVKEIV
jgi:hypothetical protein